MGEGTDEAPTLAKLEYLLGRVEPFVLVCDARGRIEWVSRIAPGLRWEDLAGKTPDEFLRPEDGPKALGTIARVASTGRPETYEARGYADEGRDAWYHVEVLPLHGDGPQVGPVHRLALVSHVIDLRKQVEQNLRRSEARLRAVLEYSPDFIAIVDAQQRIEYLNRFDELSPEQALGASLSDLTPPEYKVAIHEAVAEVLDGAPSRTLDSKDASGRVYEVRCVPYPSADGRNRALVLAADVHERRQWEAAQADRQARSDRRQRLESLGLLAGGIAHDFNNLLMVVFGQLRVAQECVEFGKSPELAHGAIEEAAQRAADLSRQILAFSRRQPLERRHLDLVVALPHAFRLLRRMIPGSIRFRFESELTQGWVHADPAKLQQVLMNLCVNAVDAQPGGGEIVVRLVGRVGRDDGIVGPGPHVALEVEDRGEGMTSEVVERAFEPFFSTKAEEHGTGLGLATVHGIVRQHGGHVEIDSEPGEGTRVTVWLPGVDEPRVEEEGATPPSRVEVSVGRGERVLVAEDDDFVRAVLERCLEEAGFEPVGCDRGDDAVARVATDPSIDAVVLDEVLPGMAGHAAYLRMLEARPGLPAVFSTGYSPGCRLEELRARPEVRVLTKPYGGEALVEAVGGLLETTRGASGR